MISGSSTPRCLARWRTRIQPEAKQETRIGQAPRPAVGEGRGRADDDGAGEVALRAAFDRRRPQIAEIDALAAIVVAELRQRAVDVDRAS